MLCELCGNDVARTRSVTVEATVLNVCSDCSRFGVESVAPVARVRARAVPTAIAERLERRARRMTPRDVYATDTDEDLVADLPLRIRRAREARGWKQTDLGAKINERVSVIGKLESGAMVPTDALVRKLERALDLKLREKAPASEAKKAAPRAPVTLGDLVKLED